MAEEHDGMDQGNPSEEYREFRRMMDSAGREDIRRLIEHLTGRIEANHSDAEALSVRGLAYSELGDHRRAAEGLRQGSLPGTPATRAPTSTGPAPTAGWRSTAWRWRTTT